MPNYPNNFSETTTREESFMRNLLEHRICALLLALAFCFGLSGIVRAQETTGTIFGTVTDPAGAAIANATVTVADIDKNIVVRTVKTDASGNYSVPLLPVGNYRVTIEATNFKKYVEDQIKLDVNQRRTVDAKLEAGNVSETVTVQAESVQIDLESPTSGTVINGAQASELSINNRNFLQLITLAPGVSDNLADQVYVGTTNPTGQANTVNIAVNGARSSQNTYLVDGADITDRGSNLTIQAYPSLDSIAEFKVLRSLYPAETGNSGGGQIDIITRSGKNKFHGNFYEFVRNEQFNANDFITNSTTNPPCGRDPDNGKAARCPFRYNDFGFTIGGPIYLPRFGEGGHSAIKLNKTFFFFSEEQRKDRRYPTFVSTVPDAALRQGIFPIPVCINLNNVPGATCTGANILPAGTPIPASLINPAARAYLDKVYNRLPLPNAPNYTLISSARGVADFRQEIVRLDHSFSEKLSMFYRFENDRIPTIDANSLFSSGSGLPGVSTTQTDSPGRTHTFETTYTLSPTTIIEGRYAYAYGAILSKNIGLLALSNFGANPVALPFPNPRDRVTSISGNGFSGLVGFGPYNNFSNKHLVKASVTNIRGNHTLKFGGMYSKYRKNENALVGDAAAAPQGIFGSFSNALPAGVPNTTLNQNLQRWANFLIGNAASFTQGSADYTADLRQSNIEAFGQDEWRYKPNLTLYYGVRYSHFGQPFDKNGRLSNFDPTLYNPANAPLVTGSGSRVITASTNLCNGIIVNSQNYITLPNCTPTVSPYGNKVVSTSNKDFAPRVGLAWDPFKKGTTSIRTGYGIYHEQVLVGFAEQIIGTNPPYQQNFTTTNTRLDAPAQGAPPLPSVTLRGIDPNWHTPYMQHWSLDVQRQITRNTVIDVGYYGSKGTHLIGVFELNEVPPGRALNSLCAPGNNTYQTPGVKLVPCQPAGYAFQNTASTANGNPNVVGTTGFTDFLILDQIRPYVGYRSITMLEPRFNSNYHSLQVSFQHRFSSASQLNVAYTWSHNLTDNQTDRSTAPQNSYDIRSDYGPATFDRRHIFRANYIYVLPFFREGADPGFASKLLGGWQTSGLVTVMSALPFTVVTSNYDPAGLGFIPAAIAGGRPNLLCDPNANAPHTPQQYFNTACFEPNVGASATAFIAVPNTVGTAPRGVVRAFPVYRVDFSLMKNIRFGESTRLQLRGEAFNVFNHTNFSGFSSTNVISSVFGQIGAVRDPRTIQLGIKFYF
jgi:hypothetical protein